MSASTLLIALADDGSLELVFEPTPTNPIERRVALKFGHEVTTIKRILQARLGQRSTMGLGEDGNPTAAQIDHWERHEIFADSRCAFCRAEGSGAKAPRRAKLRSEFRGNGSVEVRTLPAKTAKGLKSNRATAQSLEDFLA